MPTDDNVARRMTREFHDDDLMRDTTQHIVVVETNEMVKDFHPNIWLGERDHNNTVKKYMTPTSIADAGAETQGFLPDLLTGPHGGTPTTCQIGRAHV